MAHTTPKVDAETRPDDLLATKLFLPLPRPNMVRRLRLTRRISEGLNGPLTLIVAPAGWGKTTVLSEWSVGQPESLPGEGVSSGRPALAWLGLDEADNDLALFLRYLIAALQTLQPDLDRAARAGLRSPQPPPTDAVLTLLLNDLAALDRNVILVLDDYHLIEAPAIHLALTFLLDHLPPQLHLVVAGRADPPLPLARLRARGQVAEVRAADLAFTADEAAEFLNRVMRLQLPVEDVAALETRTEGWIAGLHLAALSMRERDAGSCHDFITALGGPNRHIFDYLAGRGLRSPAARGPAFSPLHVYPGRPERIALRCGHRRARR